MTGEHAGPYVAAAAVLASVVVIALAAVYAFYEQEQVAERICLSVVENREADRSQWLAVRRFSIESGTPPERVDPFIEAALRPIPALECRNNKPVPKEE